METQHRTLLKTISWRIIATVISFGIAYFISKDIGIASSIASIQVVVHTIFYYIHERMWNKIKWGKN